MIQLVDVRHCSSTRVLSCSIHWSRSRARGPCGCVVRSGSAVSRVASRRTCSGRAGLTSSTLRALPPPTVPPSRSSRPGRPCFPRLTLKYQQLWNFEQSDSLSLSLLLDLLEHIFINYNIVLHYLII